jgi:transposase
VGKRRAGKSDAIDAVRAARELLARPRPAQMRADGDREALRLLMVDRDNAVQSCKTARAALASVLVTAPAPLRERLRPLPRARADPAACGARRAGPCQGRGRERGAEPVGDDRIALVPDAVERSKT